MPSTKRKIYIAGRCRHSCGRDKHKNSEYGFIGSAYFDRDFYVSKADFGGALDKDVVVFQIKHKLSPIRGMNREAKVLAVKSRNMKFVVGELEKKKNVFIFVSTVKMWIM